MVNKNLGGNKGGNKGGNNTIYDMIRKGLYPAQIAKKLGVSRKTISKHTERLKASGYIRFVSNGVWEITNKKVVTPPSLGTTKGLTPTTQKVYKPITNIHALQIRFPILEGVVKDDDWVVKEKLRHWCPKYTTLTDLGGLTLKNNNNRSLSVFVHRRNIGSVDEVDSLVFSVRRFVFEFFRLKHGVLLDVVNAEVKNVHLATEDRVARGMNRKSDKFSLDLGKKAGKILPIDDMDGKAWIDGSPFDFSAESNDKDWKRAYLDMPFSVAYVVTLLGGIKEYNDNIRKHLAVQEAQLRTHEGIDEKLGFFTEQVVLLRKILEEIQNGKE